MIKKENKAPIMFTSKDLDYLKDMFGWNYAIYKLGINIIDCISDEELKKGINTCNKFCYDNMKEILTILGDDQNE